jgi:hypothetical protein
MNVRGGARRCLRRRERIRNGGVLDPRDDLSPVSPERRAPHRSPGGAALADASASPVFVRAGAARSSQYMKVHLDMGACT